LQSRLGWLRRHPARRFLYVTVELCSTSIRLDKLTKANIVATALFGDGAAACVLRAGEQGLASIGAGAEILWPETLGIMGWDVEDPGLGVIFDRAIPPFVEEHMSEGVRQIAAKSGLTAADIDPLHLPSRRREGGRGAGGEPWPGGGGAGP
jgi:alkylresorcinol/alkylpyrone synthase